MAYFQVQTVSFSEGVYIYIYIFFFFSHFSRQADFEGTEKDGLQTNASSTTDEIQRKPVNPPFYWWKENHFSRVFGTLDALTILGCIVLELLPVTSDHS